VELLKNGSGYKKLYGLQDSALLDGFRECPNNGSGNYGNSTEKDTTAQVKTISNSGIIEGNNRICEIFCCQSRGLGPSCSLAEALQKQDLFVNSTLAQLGCNILWKMFRQGMIEYQGLYLNLETIKVNPIGL
jgi:hypothetical protein